MYWYADNSELNGIRGANIPDILIFGGVVVPPDSEVPLREAIENAKSVYCDRRAPVKWNFKDLKKTYKTINMEDLYRDLLQSSQEWRRAIFESVRDIDFTIIMSCLESYSIEREKIKDIKSHLSSYVFSNGLMRYALAVKEICPQRARVVLDWPDKQDKKPFDSEYARAYREGKSTTGVPYKAGNLQTLGFHDSVLFTNMLHSTILQFADLLVGATREFIECSVGKKPNGFGVEMLNIVCSRFRGFPDKILGYGINIAPKGATVRSQVKSGINKYFFT